MRLIALILGLALCLSAMASDPTPLYFHIKTTENSYSVFSLNDIDKLTFKDGDMNIEKNGTTVKTFKRSSLCAMKVDDSSSGIQVATDDSTSQWFEINGSAITVRHDCNMFKLYNVAGTELVSIPRLTAGQSIDLSSMPNGIYVIDNGKQPAKIKLR